MKYSKKKHIISSIQLSPEPLKYKKKELSMRKILPKQHLNYNIINNKNLNIEDNETDRFSSIKKRIYNILTNYESRNKDRKYFRRSSEDKEGANAAKDLTQINQNILTDKRNFNNIKINNDYSPNFSNFDNSIKVNIKQINSNDNHKIIPPLNFQNLKSFKQYNTDRNVDYNENMLKYDINDLKASNIKNKFNPRNNLVICANNFIEKNDSFSDINYDERSRSGYSYDNKNDFHNYLKMGPMFVKINNRKNGNNFDSNTNQGGQTERLRNNMILYDQNKKINSLITQGRINKFRKKIPNPNMNQFRGNYYYNNNTINNFYPQTNFRYNEYFGNTYDNNYYIPQRKRKSFSSFNDGNIKYARPNLSKYFDYNLKPNNQNKNYNILTNYNIGKNKESPDYKKINNNIDSINKKFDNPNNTDKRANIEGGDKNIKKTKNAKGKQYIISKYNNKILIRKKNKEIKERKGNKNIQTFKVSSFELNLGKSSKIQKDLKDGIYIINIKNGKPVFETKINDSNLKKINKYLKEEKITINNSLIELNLFDEIKDLKAKYEKMKKEFELMKNNILSQNASSNLINKNQELNDGKETPEKTEKKEIELSDEKERKNSELLFKKIKNNDLGNIDINEDKKSENEIIDKKKRYKRREIINKNNN